MKPLASRVLLKHFIKFNFLEEKNFYIRRFFFFFFGVVAQAEILPRLFITQAKSSPQPQDPPCSTHVVFEPVARVVEQGKNDIRA